MPDNKGKSPNSEITVISDDVVVVNELQLVITTVTLPRKGAKKRVVTKDFRVMHHQLLPENRGLLMIQHMLLGTPLGHRFTLLTEVEDKISDACLRLCASTGQQHAFFYFFLVEVTDSKENDVLHFVALTEAIGSVNYAEILKKCWTLLLRSSKVKSVEAAVASSEEQSSCVICLKEYSGYDEENAGRLPCSHLFHVWCILRWLLESNSCPLCRSRSTPPGCPSFRITDSGVYFQP